MQVRTLLRWLRKSLQARLGAGMLRPGVRRISVSTYLDVETGARLIVEVSPFSGDLWQGRGKGYSERERRDSAEETHSELSE